VTVNSLDMEIKFPHTDCYRLVHGRMETESFSNVIEEDIDDAVTEVDYDDALRIGGRVIPKLNWTRLNCKGEDHDNRRLIEHRVRNCQCEVCFRELNKLPPDDPVRVKYALRKHKEEEREKKRVKKKAKKDVKAGRQACIRNFFRY
jgi:hypothetical protein